MNTSAAWFSNYQSVPSILYNSRFLYTYNTAGTPANLATNAILRVTVYP
jgi:hypothetical protein